MKVFVILAHNLIVLVKNGCLMAAAEADVGGPPYIKDGAYTSQFSALLVMLLKITDSNLFNRQASKMKISLTSSKKASTHLTMPPSRTDNSYANGRPHTLRRKWHSYLQNDHTRS